MCKRSSIKSVAIPFISLGKEQGKARQGKAREREKKKETENGTR